MRYDQWRGLKRGPLRRTLQLLGCVATIVALGLALASCGSDEEGGASSSTSQGSGAGETLNVLTWETYDEPEWLEEFEQETGISVNAVNVGSPAEMFSKVKANPGQFDVVFPTAGWFPQYVEDGLLEEIDTSRVPKMKNIELGFPWEEATSVDGKLYGILYNWGDAPLAWIPDDVKGLDLSKYENEKGELDDWNVLWDPALKGKVGIVDDPTSIEPMIPLALGFADPYNLDEKEFEAFEQKLMELRPQVKRLTSGFDDQTAQLASGEASAVILNIITIKSLLKEEGVILDVNHTVKQGMPAWSDNLAITKEGGAKKLDAVYEFVSASLDPKWQARFIGETLNSGTLNYEQAASPEAKSAGLTPAKLEETLIPATKAGDAFFSKMRFFEPVEDLQRRLDVWNEFKLGLGS